MRMLKLYNFERSGNCYRARLMLGLLGLGYEKTTVDLTKGQHLTPDFLALNPKHQIPVLEDEGRVLRDSMAIIVYLAARHGSGTWYPTDPVGQGDVQQWLSFAVNETFHGLAVPRAIVNFGRRGDLVAAQAIGRESLAVLEGRLRGHPWLVLDRPTVADVACYPYVALAPMGGISLAPYPAVLDWCARFEALPGWVATVGTPVGKSGGSPS
jgi:glutathione S-transferase